MIAKSRNQLYVVMIFYAGPVKGARLAYFCDQWLRCVEHYGRPITAQEYATWADNPTSQRTSWAHLALFRAVFSAKLGGSCTPNDLMKPVFDRVAREALERTR